MTRERQAAIVVVLVALVLALVLVMAAGQIGYENPQASIPPF